MMHYRPPSDIFGGGRVPLSPRDLHHGTSSVAGPTVWNLLPDSLRDPAVESERFNRT